ncbi:cyclase family protein [Halomarina ordinaria]|uniref:Cyclase family protein n=1 Tax=Halomarina ordinaria TaxID=3033939 RepID=A0ABD5UBE5_9EURY|nr:cyclase family protein [Halomarina sp. PSRA2]
MYDLTHPVAPGMPTYPGDPVVETWPDATVHADGYQVTAFGMSTHTGTHIDAPRHVDPEGKTLDEYDLERFRFEAVVVDCPMGTDEPITEDLVPSSDADLLLFHTGWSDYWGQDVYYDYPYLSTETAERCAECGFDVGVDTPSVDPVGADLFAHNELFSADRLIIENLTNLGALPERVTVFALPVPLTDADGAPARVVALE